MNRRILLRSAVPLLFVLAALDVPAQQPAVDADLGTPADAFDRFEGDYRRAVEAAVPRFDGERLAERLRSLHARHPDGIPGITATDAAALARQMEERIADLRPRQAEYNSANLERASIPGPASPGSTATWTPSRCSRPGMPNAWQRPWRASTPSC